MYFKCVYCTGPLLSIFTKLVVNGVMITIFINFQYFPYKCLLKIMMIVV